MNILDCDNNVFNLENLPALVNDFRYCILDYSDIKNVDFFFQPLIFIDLFSRPAADLQIGPYRVTMPLDWSVLIADKNFGYLEILEIKHLNDREFDVFAMNPISGYMPEFHEISIENIFPDFSWNMPKLKFGHLLAVPLHSGKGAPCAFFVKDTNKLPEVLDITKIFADPV